MKIKATFKFKGKTESVVVNHEEQDAFSELRKRKTFGFSASDDEIRSFVDESHFDSVNLEYKNEKVRLNDVTRTKIEKKGNDWHLKLSFKSVS